ARRARHVSGRRRERGVTRAARRTRLASTPHHAMNILVRAPNWLGDIVMSLPAIATIRRHFPEATLTLAAPPAFTPLCAAAPGVDAVLALPKGRSRRARDARVRAIREGGFETGILLTNSFGSALDLWRAGVPERWGFRA